MRVNELNLPLNCLFSNFARVKLSANARHQPPIGKLAWPTIGWVPAPTRRLASAALGWAAIPQGAVCRRSFPLAAKVCFFCRLESCTGRHRGVCICRNSAREQPRTLKHEHSSLPPLRTHPALRVNLSNPFPQPIATGATFQLHRSSQQLPGYTPRPATAVRLREVP